MRVTLKSYISLLLCTLIIITFFINKDFGFIMSLYFLTYNIFNKFIRLKIVKTAYFFIFFAFLIAYFIRGYVLIPYPDFFLFSRSFFVLEERPIISALWEILGFFVLMSLGFFIGINKRKQPLKRKKKNNFFDKNWPLKYFKSLIRLFYLLIFIKLTVTLGTGAGIKGEEITSSWAFLLRLVPDDLIFIVSILYLLRYHKFLNNNQKITLYALIGLMSLSILITGSKVFLILFGLGAFIALLYEGYKLKKRQLLLFSLLGFFVIFGSFSMSKVVRTENPDSFVTLLSRTLEEMGSSDNLILVDMVTSRFIGLDGYLASENALQLYSDETLIKYFGIKNTLLNTLEYIIPFVNLTDVMTSGKAASVYVLGLSVSIINSSAVGLFGMLNLMQPGYVWLLSFIFAWLVAKIYNRINRIVDEDVKLIVFYFFTYFIIHCFMSGNFNVLIGGLVIKLILLLVYLRFNKFIFKYIRK